MSDNNILNGAVNVFFSESREMLDVVETCLLDLEKDSGNLESINALFRAVHTIKGSSGMFGFSEIEKFTHVVENLLDKVRKLEITITNDIIETLLLCRDYIDSLLGLYEIDQNMMLDESQKEYGTKLLMELSGYGVELPLSSNAGKDLSGQDSQTIDAISKIDNSEKVANADWHISIRLNKEVFKNGLDPMSFISYLNELGTIENIIIADDNLPDFLQMDPESCYLGFEIIFNGAVDKHAIEEVFEFLRDDCRITILPPESSINDYVNLLSELPESPKRIGELLLRVGALTEKELNIALNIQSEITLTANDKNISVKPLGEIMVEEKMVDNAVISAALDKQRSYEKSNERKNKSIRIDAEKLDDLINLIGELVITGANVKQITEQYDNPQLSQSTVTMSRLVENIRDRIMNIRMVPIGDTFQRFERVVRDLCKDTGKDVRLIISGGDTELDKTLIEKISDPLMHLIRNSVDHGFDMPNVRKEKGKPGSGTIHLNAYQETGNIVIEIRDDGNGLNKEKIYEKAVRNGLLQQGERISDSDLYQLIFKPGFSTAEKITNISGRGVGMDVVKRNIELLRGTIILDSIENVGMTIKLYLPLTLAIIDGFLATVNESHFIIPLDMVREVFEVKSADLQKKEGMSILNLRGDVLPFLRLREYFNIPLNNSQDLNEYVVVVEYGQKRAGIVFDSLVGEFQTVIKSMGKLFSELKWISGATIMGSGAVAIILDVPMLLKKTI